MSRIGKKPITVPEGVTATLDGQTVTAKGPKGELQFVVNESVLVNMEDGVVTVNPKDGYREVAHQAESAFDGPF